MEQSELRVDGVLGSSLPARKSFEKVARHPKIHRGFIVFCHYVSKVQREENTERGDRRSMLMLCRPVDGTSVRFQNPRQSQAGQNTTVTCHDLPSLAYEGGRQCRARI